MACHQPQRHGMPLCGVPSPCGALRSYPNPRRPHVASRHGVTVRVPRSLHTHGDPTPLRHPDVMACRSAECHLPAGRHNPCTRTETPRRPPPHRHGMPLCGVPSPCGSLQSLCTHRDPPHHHGMPHSTTKCYNRHHHHIDVFRHDRNKNRRRHRGTP